MAEFNGQEQTDHFFRYTDPNKQLFVRLDQLEKRIAALESAVPRETPQDEQNPDFRAWVKGEIQAIKMRMGRLAPFK